MTRRVRLTTYAQADLDQIFAYIGRDNPRAAGDRLDRWHIDAARNFGRYLVRTSLSSHLISCIERLLIRA
jgi:plasmid stabilization system protein ParE